MSRVLSELVRHLGRAASRDGLSHLTDAELLRRFTAEKDPLAFEALVWRHGAMVLGVCGRVLGRGADTEDAFQATFLALVRHARSVRAGDTPAGWLYRVARRASVRAGRERVARVRRERLAARPVAVTHDDVERADWRAALDREVDRLPPRYREAFLLCHLEGRSHEDAARELGCPLGTLHSRLARAKERLRGRLAAPSVTGVAGLAVTGRLVGATVAAAVGLSEGAVVTAAAAVALSQGVWSPMAMLNAKVLALAVVAAATFGSGVVLSERPAATAGQGPATSAPAEPTVEELKRENARRRREVEFLKRQVAVHAKAAALMRQSALHEKGAAPTRDDDPPADAEVLRALPKAAAEGVAAGDDVTIVKAKVSDRYDPARAYPLIGVYHMRHRHWECTVYFTATESKSGKKSSHAQVVYLDPTTLVRVADVAR